MRARRTVAINSNKTKHDNSNKKPIKKLKSGWGDCKEFLERIREDEGVGELGQESPELGLARGTKTCFSTQISGTISHLDKNQDSIPPPFVFSPQRVHGKGPHPHQIAGQGNQKDAGNRDSDFLSPRLCRPVGQAAPHPPPMHAPLKNPPAPPPKNYARILDRGAPSRMPLLFFVSLLHVRAT